MTKIYKVSLFDDRQPDKRIEMGLPLNNNLVFFTTDEEKAYQVFEDNEKYLYNNGREIMREPGKESGVSVNICATWGFDKDGVCRWNWTTQSNFDYII